MGCADEMLNSGNTSPTQEATSPDLIKENQQLPLVVDDDGKQIEELKCRLARLAGRAEAWGPREFIRKIVP